MPNTIMDEMTLLGDLKVPNPEICGLGEARVNYISSILPDLKKLDERNHRGMSNLQCEQPRILIGCLRHTWTRRLVFWLKGICGEGSAGVGQFHRCNGPTEIKQFGQCLRISEESHSSPPSSIFIYD